MEKMNLLVKLLSGAWHGIGDSLLMDWRSRESSAECRSRGGGKHNRPSGALVPSRRGWVISVTAGFRLRSALLNSSPARNHIASAGIWMLRCFTQSSTTVLYKEPKKKKSSACESRIGCGFPRTCCFLHSQNKKRLFSFSFCILEGSYSPESIYSTFSKRENATQQLTFNGFT